jgi:hypothetical protein
MAASALTFYNVFSESLGNNTVNMNTDSIRLALFTSSYTPNAGTQVSFSALTNQVTGANGYTTGGATLTYGGVTRWAQSGGTATFRAENVAWTATGGSITARYAVLYSNTAGTNNLIGYILLDTTPADVTVTDTNTLTIQWNASGIFTLASA